MIDSMFQEGTDTALDDQIARPKYQPATSPAFNLLGLGAAPFRGIGGGVAKSLAFGAEVVGAFGQAVRAMDQATPEQRRKNDRQGLPRPDMSNEVGDVLRQRAADILPDPKTAHVSEQVVAGLTDFATRAVGYGVTLGPLGPLATGADVALEEADRLKQQGVDLETRTKAGATAGAIAGVSVAVPMAGSTRLARGAIGLGVGEAGIVGQSLAERQILRAAGYDKIADTFDPFDPVALAVGAVPGVLGFAMPTRAIKPPRTEADVKAAVKLTPEEAAREAAYERSPTNLRELERAIAAEKRPEVRADLEAELRKQTAAAAGDHAVERAVQAEPDLVPAARVRQTAQALEDTRLTPDTDLAGRDAHLSAVEMAGDQMGRGEPVEVAPRLDSLLEQTRRIAEATKPITRDEALPLIAGKTEKPGGVDPVKLMGEGEYRLGRVPLDLFVQNEEGARYDGTVNAQRAADYATRAPDNVPPIIATQGRRGENPGLLRVMDGGHRISAARMRGDTHIDALVRLRHPLEDVHQTAAAADQLRALRQPAERAPSHAEVKAAEAVRPAPQEGTGKAPAGPKAAPAGESEASVPASVARAADEVAKLDPDMMVQLEGMDTPMRVGDLLERVKEEARQDTLMGKLVEVAAECSLTA